jgi:hypothetical protein
LVGRLERIRAARRSTRALFNLRPL